MNIKYFLKHPFFCLSRLKRKIFSNMRGFFHSLGKKSGRGLAIGKGSIIDCANIVYGKNVSIGNNVHIFGQGHIQIGDNTSIGDNCEICSALNIVIGNDVMIAANTYIIDCNHGTLGTTIMRQQPLSIKTVEIGNNVWIGTLSAILAGANIGDGTVIGAGSIVSSLIPQDSFVVPSRELFIKNRV